MSVVQNSRDELEDIRSIQTLSGVMRDLSVGRVQKLREDFQRNLDFYDEVEVFFNQVQSLVNQNYSKIAAEMRKRPVANIAVTSNHRFYGALNREVIELFLKNWAKADEHLIIGKTGQSQMEGDERYGKCKFIFFEDDNPTHWEMQKFVSLTKGYSRAVVYFPKYRTPFHQEPATMDLVHLTEGGVDIEDRSLDEFIFEPDLPLIHDFFSTQVQYILIQRIMLETDLSRTAKRLVRMDTAESSATEMYAQKEGELRANIQRQLDISLFESISGLKKWET